MSITRSPQTEAMVRQKIADVPYQTTDDVIDEALRLLDARDRRVREVRASVLEGFAAIERGEGIELTAAIIERLSDEAELRARRGDQPHPDVCG